MSPVVSVCSCVPSASIDWIFESLARPLEEFANTMCRPSGDHDGKSHRPMSCVSWIQRSVAISIT